MPTYEEIEAECERFVATLGSTIPPEGKTTMAAYLQHKSKLPITARCIHCGELMTVTDSGTAWSVSCPCGRSTLDLRGL